ncbi:histidine phosphotransferase family protein [Mangrovicoccus sp. HB161399]|uniref:histidine phosphotransferase family protein n=1 Tax=Mangrovicoccus sp. HB161399 TaxID=2720392 RepID=UPI0015576830|nr:histidine phosphotransferase family protein [Mangrovicoccus sp. HB161399]
MTKNAHDLTALLGSRICHDLISPLGAIGNGLELLSMTGAGGAEMSLIAESVANANARVRFYRIAYGASSSDQAMGRTEVSGILDDITRGGRVKIAWNCSGPVSRPEAKLAFLLIQCLETAMPYGGEIVVTSQDGTWRIHGLAEKLKVMPELWDRLTSPSADLDITPAQVQFALAPEMMDSLGLTAEVQIRDRDILVSY